MSATPRSGSRELVATAALVVWGLALAAGFARTFPGWGFLADLAVLVVVGHATPAVLRRVGARALVAVPATLLVLLWLLGVQRYRDTLTWTLPTRETWRVLRDELALVIDQFPTAVAPVEYGAGWAVLAGIGIVLVVVLADAFVFHAEARGEALVPGVMLFVVVAAVGAPRLQVATTVAVAAAGVLVLAATRALHDRSRRAEPLGRRHRPWLLTASVGTAGAVALVAGVVGPRLPGVGDEPIVETRGRDGGVTEVISPLVDIRGRIVSQSSSELFRVRASEPAYWRVTTLPEFDGTTFRLPSRPLVRAEGDLGTARTGAVEIRQDIEIVGLGGQLVPAAADPIAASGADLRWNADTGTLVRVGDPLQRGERFTVVSASPRVQPSELRASGSVAVSDPIHLALPTDFPDDVRELAAEVTADATTGYDRALALQDWFRREFRYSLDVQPGHGTSAIESFLRERVGYCEQFAATFAAMARSIGLPSRVAVGFTPGLRLPDGAFSVLGKQAHAWPEVWFDGIGWVPFEPTPGRGAPGTEQYTGVAPAQDTTPAGERPDDGSGAAATTTTLPTTSTTRPDGAGDGGALAPQLPEEDDGASGGAAGDTADGTAWWRGFLVSSLIVALVMAPSAVRALRHRWERRADPDRQVVLAWTRARRAARAAGVAGSASWTTSEWVAAMVDAMPVASRPVRSLATVVDQVAYAPPGRVDLEAPGAYGTTLARECANWARQVEAIADDGRPFLRRIGDHFLRLH